MTVQEAKKHLENIFPKNQDKRRFFEECIDIAIECMEEVEQYRALGTVEEIKKKIQTELPYMSLAQARFKSELDEYRNLGTVEELKEAREKQVAKKPKEYEDRYYACECGNILLPKWKKYPTELMPKSEGLPHCMSCGQKIDWSGEDD